MSDQRSVMKEFRSLEQKRQVEGLTPDEAARFQQLRDLMGAEAAPAPRSGFDVNAAAARLRESLLPAGLRSRPPEPPAPPPPPAPEPPPALLDLEAAYEAQPFAPLEPAAPPDPLFDPASLGAEVRPQAWNPEAPGYDPDAPYDEAAWIAAGYDPNVTYDWSASGAPAEGAPEAAAEAPAEAALEGLAAEPAAVGELEPAPAQGWDGFAPLEAAEAAWTEPPPEPAAALELEPIGEETAVPAAEAPFEEATFPTSTFAAVEPAWAEPALEAAPEAGAWDGATDAGPLEAAAAAAAAPAEPDFLDVGAEPPPAHPPALMTSPAWREAPAAATGVPDEELPFDPNAPFDHAKWFGREMAGAAPATDAAPEPAVDEGPLLEPVPPPIEIIEAEYLPDDDGLAPAEAAPAEGEPAEPLPPGPAFDLAFEPDPAPPEVPVTDLLVDDGAELPSSDVEITGSLELAEPAPEPEPAADAAPPEPAFELSFEPDPVAAATEAALPPAAPPAAFGEYDAPGAPAIGPGAPAAALADVPPAPAADPTASWFDEAPPPPEAPAAPAFGEYDEAAAPAARASLESLLPFDPASAAAIESGRPPEGYEPGDLASEPGAVLDPATLGPLPGDPDADGFTSDQMYGGPEGDALPGGAPLELGEAVAEWQPDAALEHGFELAGDGSFGEFDAPPQRQAPAWSSAEGVAAEGWESAPALDLAAPFEQPPALGAVEPEPPALAPPLDLAAEAAWDAAAALPEAAPIEASPMEATFAEPAYVEPADVEPADVEPEPAAEPPVLEEAELLEELPAAAWTAPAEVAPIETVGPLLAPVEAGLEAAPPEAAAVHEPWLDAPPPDAPPAEPEIPPEIAAAFAGLAEPEPEPFPAPAEPFELPPAATGLFAEPPPAAGPFAFGAGAEQEPEPVIEPLPSPAGAAILEPLPEEAFEPLPEEAAPLASPGVLVEGSHRVVVHTVEGQVKRGLLVDAWLDAAELELAPQGPGAPDRIPTDAVKAIFFMLAPGEKAPPPEGKRVRVTFRDGRQVAGFSPDYAEGLAGFFMIPADTRTNTGRIWVYQAAVRQVAVS